MLVTNFRRSATYPSQTSRFSRLAAWAIVLAACAAAQPTDTVKDGASSSGWIDFAQHSNVGIFLPVKINGHQGMAWLYGGPSAVDKGLSESLTTPASVEIQLGDLTLRNISARAQDLQPQAKALGQPLLGWVGKEVFNRLAVEIDFAHRKIAFRDPKTLTRPAGAVEVPLVEMDGERVLPVSVDGAPRAQFEIELGNVIGPLMTTPAYAQAHKLLEGHPTSLRLSGPYSETIVSVDHLSFAGVQFSRVPIALIPNTELPPASITGGVGLPLLSKFKLIVIDYSSNRLYAVPDLDAAKAGIEKDRIGMVLGLKEGAFAVRFVSPHSPAEAAGFKSGDKIALIDGKPIASWPAVEIAKFQLADPGTVHTFTMPDGIVRQIKAADFF